MGNCKRADISLNRKLKLPPVKHIGAKELCARLALNMGPHLHTKPLKSLTDTAKGGEISVTVEIVGQ